ncbi:MAG: hypothetical protein WCN95_13600, partial [bacterium]
IKTGVKARALRNYAPYEKSVLLLLGGSDTKAEPLPKNSQVPEATLLETIKYTNFLDWFGGMGYATSILPVIAVIVLVLMVFGKLMKGAMKLLMFLFAAGLLILSIWFVKYQWDKYKTTLASPEFAQKVDTFIAYPFKSPEAVLAWAQMKKDLEDLASEARTNGATAYEKARKEFANKLGMKIDELKAKGKEQAAKELESARLLLEQ